MKTQIEAAGVIRELTRYIETTQKNTDHDRIHKFDGEAVFPLMQLMFATKELFTYQSPAEFADALMELLDSHFFRSSYNVDDSGESNVKIDRMDGANALFNIKLLITLICKSFTALQDFEQATGMV